MGADGTDLRRLRRFADVAAVAALPDDLLVLLEDLLILDVREQNAIALLVLLLDLCDGLEEIRDLREALFPCDLGKLGIHRRPFLVLAVSGRLKVLRRRADARDELEPDLRMLLLVARSLREKRRNLLEAVLLRTRCIVAVLRISLRLTGKCRPKILFRL